LLAFSSSRLDQVYVPFFELEDRLFSRRDDKDDEEGRNEGRVWCWVCLCERRWVGRGVEALELERGGRADEGDGVLLGAAVAGFSTRKKDDK